MLEVWARAVSHHGCRACRGYRALATRAAPAPATAAAVATASATPLPPPPPTTSAGTSAGTPASGPVTPRARGFTRWYLDAVAAAELVDGGTPVRGCLTLRPRGFAVWALVRRDLEARIRALGAEDVYFPLLVPAPLLAREAAHVAGFARDVAVVTHTRLAEAPGGGGLCADASSRLAEPLVVRPTSEALVWDAFSRWVRSHADLPLRVNQWAGVVRWERRTRPFVRSSEFLWQEGHSAHASAHEAAALARAALDMYTAHLATALAVPCVPGAKSPSERFAGADATLTCEVLVQNGWALQAATAHDLGQRFARGFGVAFARRTSWGGGEREFAWGTSWGASTRLIGAAIMTHGDDVGVLFPPAVAPVQVVVVAVVAPGKGKGAGAGEAAGAASVTSDAAAAAISHATAIADALRERGAYGGAPLRVALDVDVGSHPGGRFFAWERKGVPLRVEVGPREAAAHTATLVDRVGALAEEAAAGEVSPALPLSTAPGKAAPPARRVLVPAHDAAALAATVSAALATVQAAMLRRATAARDARIRVGATYAELRAHAAEVSGAGGAASAQQGGDGTDGDDGNDGDNDCDPLASTTAAPAAAPIASAFLVPWCDDAAAEARVKAETRFTLRCFPLEGQDAARGQACFMTGRPATHMALFARAF